MKSKLRIIIPIGIAVIAIALAFVFIRFAPTKASVDIGTIISTAQQYLTEQKYEQAVAEFQKIIDIDPKNADAYIGLAKAYIGLGDTDKAVEVLEDGYDRTGDVRILEMLEELKPAEETTVETTIEAMTETEASSSSNEAKILEKRIEYADDWYSILKYDENENIISMDLYSSSDQKRLSANYDYSGSSVKRSVYVDDELYEEKDVTFSDIMAEEEEKKKNRANTTEHSDGNWWVYDENGECIEHGWNNSDSDGNILSNSGQIGYFKNGKLFKTHCFGTDYDTITYYDEKGYEIKETGMFYGTEINNVYTYDYDENGYPIACYINGEKDKDLYFYNEYKDGVFAYSITHIKNELNNNHIVKGNDGYDLMYEANDNKQYLRSIIHSYYDYEIDNFDAVNTVIVYYYVFSNDGSKVIDRIGVPKTELPLFGCPYCYEEN